MILPSAAHARAVERDLGGGAPPAKAARPAGRASPSCALADFPAVDEDRVAVSVMAFVGGEVVQCAVTMLKVEPGNESPDPGACRIDAREGPVGPQQHVQLRKTTKQNRLHKVR